MIEVEVMSVVASVSMVVAVVESENKSENKIDYSRKTNIITCSAKQSLLNISITSRTVLTKGVCCVYVISHHISLSGCFPIQPATKK